MMRNLYKSSQIVRKFFLESDLTENTSIQYAYYLLHLNGYKEIYDWNYLKDVDTILGIINQKKSPHTKRGYLTSVLYVLDNIENDDEFHKAKGRYIQKFYGIDSYKYYIWKSER